MKILPLLFVSLFTFHFSSGLAQDYDIVIKGGHVIDAKNGIDKVIDIAVKDGKISKVAKKIDPTEGIQVVDAGGLYVTPGLIDIHPYFY